MKVGRMILSAIGIVNAINVRENLGNDRIVSVAFEDWTSEINEVMNSFEADSFGPKDEGMHFKLSGSEVDMLKNLNVQFEDSTEDWLTHFENNFNDPNLFCSGTQEECAGRSLDDFYENYQGFDTIIERVEGLVADSSNAEVKSIGTTFEGRDIKIVEIGVQDESKPIGFLFCNIHAREWLTPMFCSFLIETLLAGHPLLDSFAFAIVPSANPDGYEYSRSDDNLWRKTRKPNSGSSCVGTDGNRNWDNNHCGVGSSTNPCSQVYCGTSPFDQQEVAALNSYSLANVDRIMVMLDIHAYGSYIIHPYGYTEVLPPEADYVRMRQCASEATAAAKEVTGTNWRYGTTPQVLGYTSGGTSKDYFYGNLGIIYPYTVEVRGSNFQPRPSNIKICNEETLALVEAMFSCAKKIEIDGEEPTLELCHDKSASNVFWELPNGDLVEASCAELPEYCTSIDSVRVNCPETCGCAFATNETPFGDEESGPTVIPKEETNYASPKYAAISFMIIVGFAVVGAVAGKTYTKYSTTSESEEVTVV